MVLKDKFKIIIFFATCFLILSIIVLFPKTNAQDLRKMHEEELEKTLEQYFDINSPSWQQFKDKHITIVFWHHLEADSTNKAFLQEIIKKFNKKYPNITVKEEFKGNWGAIDKNINIALPANNEPNLIVSYPDFLVNFYESGKLVPLDSFIGSNNTDIKLFDDKDKEEKRFYPLFEEESQITLGEGKDKSKKWYSLPFYKSIELMFYNQTYFASLKNNKNIKKEDLPWLEQLINDKGKLKQSITWKDMKKLCEIIKKIAPQKIPICYDSESNLFIVSSEQRKITYVEKPDIDSKLGVYFNNSDSQHMIQEFKQDFIDKGYLTTHLLSGEKYIDSLFCDQKILMHINSSKGFEYLSKANFEVGVTACPYWEKGKNESGQRKALQQGANVNLFYKKDKDEVLASWLFLKHLVSRETSDALFEQKSTFPMRPSYVNTTKIEKYKEDIDKSSSIQFENSTEQTQKEKKELLRKKVLCFMFDERKEEDKTKQSVYFFSPVFQRSYIARIVVNKLVVECFLEKELDKNIKKLFELAQEQALS
ncbi:extracellular solute-binding protein ['Fragaria x ananassa' phyllody phytoplasma]|uniref:Extracellular solute-binding protein n=1 Tax='Fragaria x ananassa' phyllody phytoplasma TaxID=2358428 RepID=A0ABS5K2Y8_9MOLU|nr:extracellular solute-binding protein ['Fragaria x ananassa' phyllody phytoplasma]MBS2126259.1 extracellular solute-binding protein ['Fragaria x ananassa' phyllody phytoplasma]